MKARTDTPYIDQRMFRSGMILHARTNGFFGRAIRLCSGSWGNHDALLVYEAGGWWVCDAEPPVAHLTAWDEWERRLRGGKCKLRFYWPAGAMSMDGRVAAKWWLRNVRNAPYDKLAFPRLLWRAVVGRWWKSQAGQDHAWWCTEATRAAWKFAGFDPWGRNNSTPLDTEEAVGPGRLDDWTGEIMPADSPSSAP